MCLGFFLHVCPCSLRAQAPAHSHSCAPPHICRQAVSEVCYRAHDQGRRDRWGSPSNQSLSTHHPLLCPTPILDISTSSISHNALVHEGIIAVAVDHRSCTRGLFAMSTIMPSGCWHRRLVFVPSSITSPGQSRSSLSQHRLSAATNPFSWPPTRLCASARNLYLHVQRGEGVIKEQASLDLRQLLGLCLSLDCLFVFAQ